MDDTSLISFLILLQLLHSTTAMFFHEPSSVLIKPREDTEHTDFGFSMGYREAPNSLVVGAPSVDFIGKVYSCDMKDASTVTEIECSENLIDFDSLAEYSRKVNPEQYFYTGSSIVATDEYIFTCAPLWTNDVRTRSGILSDAFGTCFMINETDTERYVGTLERYIKKRFTTNLMSFIGGIGWSTLEDKDNDLLLIVKTTLNGDFMYTSRSNPLEPTKSIATDRAAASVEMTRDLYKYWNIGYGVTAGKFFSNKTVYAFSMELKDMGGAISFLEYNPKRKYLSMMYKSKIPYMLKSKAINSMFGTVMWAADLNMDGLDEMLVGAPTQSEEDCVECGAVYIFLGGNKDTLDDKNRLRIILGDKDYSRFGSSVASADLDGDSIPELAISAPYEDNNIGAVYILSGYEVYQTLVKFQTFRLIQLSNLKLTQRIQKKTFRTLGFSLQFVPDADDNGCSELSTGSPGSGRVLLFKCVQAINVTVSSQLIGEQILREQDSNFTVQVCVQVEKHELPYDIFGNITVTNSIIGEATYIPEPRFVIDISCYNCTRNRQTCENVTVFLNDHDPGDYLFTSKAELNVEHIYNSTEFNSTWVVASPYSQLERRLEIARHCKGDDCIPKLSMDVLWSGDKKYVLGSSLNETVTIRVRNDGNASYESCVWVRVTGASLPRLGCNALNDGYQCYLPKPLRRSTEHSIKLVLNMTRPTDLYKELQIDVFLYENCNQVKEVTTESHLRIPYIFTPDDIYVLGSSHHSNVTDKQIVDSDYIQDNQEYQIVNNGFITWHNIQAVISMEKKPFLLSYEVSVADSGVCREKKNFIENITYVCDMKLIPNSTQKIIGISKLGGNKIEQNLIEEKLYLTSTIVLYIQQTKDFKYGNSTSVMHFQTELSFANNKWYIALLVILLAIIIMAIVIFILYKSGFFRRKQKQRLHVLRESLKRKNSRRTTLASEGNNGMDGLQIDVVDDSPFDDSPFDDVPMADTTQDNAVLVEPRT